MCSTRLHISRLNFFSGVVALSWCVAVCCGVLQCAAVCCGVLRCVAVCCGVLRCVAVCKYQV